MPYGRWGSGAPPCRTGSPLPGPGRRPPRSASATGAEVPRGAAGAGQWPGERAPPRPPRRRRRHRQAHAGRRPGPGLAADRGRRPAVVRRPGRSDPPGVRVRASARPRRRLRGPRGRAAGPRAPRRRCVHPAALRGSHPPGVAAGGGGGGPGAARPGRGAPARARRLGHHRARRRRAGLAGGGAGALGGPRRRGRLRRLAGAGAPDVRRVRARRGAGAAAGRLLRGEPRGRCALPVPPLAAGHLRSRLPRARTDRRTRRAARPPLRQRRTGGVAHPLDTARLARRAAGDPFPARVEEGEALARLTGDAPVVRDADAVASPVPPGGAFGIG